MPQMAGPQPYKKTALDAMLLTKYLKDPVAFVREQLGETPSPDQAKFLMDLADLSNKYIILTAGRGAGKTKVVSWASAWSMAVLPMVFGKYDCRILGGSKQQSNIMYRYFTEHIHQTKYLEGNLVSDYTKSETVFHTGTIESLAASEKQVRGPHVDLLILDEVCEIDDELIRSALPMVTGSSHGRIIMLSTPHRFLGVFQEYWDNHELYGFKRHGPWPLTNCTWIDQEWVELMRRQYSPEKFAVEIMGQPTTFGSLVFNPEHIKKCIADKPFGMDTNYTHDAGIDWGYANPTVLVAAQAHHGKIWFPGPDMSWQRMDYMKVQEDMKLFHDKYRGADYFADSSHIGEVERLAANGINAEGVIWKQDMKEQLVEVLQYYMYKGLITISPDKEELITALRKYRWDTPKDGGREKLTKKDADHVEAMMLCFYTIWESGRLEGILGKAKPQRKRTLMPNEARP